MSTMNGIKNFLEFVNNNYVTILVVLGLIVGIYNKTKQYLSQSKNEKVEIAKSQLKETMLKLITKAEESYENWNKSGSIKRSQVISEIFQEYPILSKVEDQDNVIHWIDTEIDNSLKTLREIVKCNSKEETD